MKVGVWQSNYIPWKGYFDYINDVDIFCFYDEVQYTKNDWRNRNRLLNDNGLFWLTIPVGTKDYKLKDTRLDRLIWLNIQLKASSYLSGLNAKNYISEYEELLFSDKGIKVKWKHYGPYLEYNRIGKLFNDQVSIIDLLMNVPQNELLKHIKSNK
jgi:hypothetical protein